MALTTSLAAGYRFEGNANDVLGANNGTASSVTFGTSYGKIGQGGNFAANGTIALPTASTAAILPSNTGDFSVSAWVKWTTGALIRVYDKLDDYSAYPYTDLVCEIATDGRLHLAFRCPGSFTFYNAYSTVSLTSGTMAHVGFSRSGSTGIVVINGSQNNTASLVNNVLQWGTVTNHRIYSDTSGTNQDETYIWTRALTADEWAELYNGGTGKYYDGSSFVAPASPFIPQISFI